MTYLKSMIKKLQIIFSMRFKKKCSLGPETQDDISMHGRMLGNGTYARFSPRLITSNAQ